MIDRSMSGMDYNRFVNLESIEDRIIYYLISPTNKTAEELKQVHNIWKILIYNDINALNNPLPKYSDVVKLIFNEEEDEQHKKRIFRSPYLGDAWTEICSMIKIYIDSIIPKNHITSVVNIGIDVICHNKIINLKASDDDQSSIIDEVDGIPIKIETVSRVSSLVKSILFLLNGAEINGVGKIQFNSERSRYNLGQYGIWNNRNYQGMKIVVSSMISGAS